MQQQARRLSEQLGHGQQVDNEALLQEAGRKARAFMTKSARPTEKVLADCFLDALEAQIRGDCAPLGDDASQCARTQVGSTPRYVSMGFNVGADGRVGIELSDDDAPARAAKAREILDMFEAARKSGLANQRAERVANEKAYV